jgi:hypothetical protein
MSFTRAKLSSCVEKAGPTAITASPALALDENDRLRHVGEASSPRAAQAEWAIG